MHDADLGRRGRLGRRERVADRLEDLERLDAEALVAVGERNDQARDDDLPVDELALGRGGRRGEDLDKNGCVAQGREAQFDRDRPRRGGIHRREEGKRVVRHERAEERLKQRGRERVGRGRGRVSVRDAVRGEAEVAVGGLGRRGRRRKPGPARLLERVNGLQRTDDERRAKVLLRLLGRRLGESRVLHRSGDHTRVGHIEERGSVLRRGRDEAVEAVLLHFDRVNDGDGERHAAALLDFAGEAQRDEVRERELLALSGRKLRKEEGDRRIDDVACRARHVLGEHLDDLVGRLGRDGLDRERERGRDALEPDVRLLELRALERLVDGDAGARVGLGDEETRPEDALDDGVGVRRVLLDEATGEVRQRGSEVLLLLRRDGRRDSREELVRRDVRLEDCVILLGKENRRDVLLGLCEARNEGVVDEGAVALLDNRVGVLEHVAQRRDADGNVAPRPK